MMKKYNPLHNTQGFTLIEILVAFAILGIMLTAFLTLFTNGYRTIFSAGHKSSAVFKAQEIMEEQLAGLPLPDGVVDHIKVVETPTTNLSINFGGQVIQVKGKTVQVKYDDNAHVVTFTSFVSEKGED